ncbi:S66 peptidase family protein [Clostridium cylindrosporum]|uniref:Murein peptide carboxypeptidase n=1 Tax=Clostridium cylindrosporum DSM 605 TaxID=1121307 RepID=A0A0J8DBN5_CLOCY|nr:LD-carboxypeptidase [Clostridium cylindrosporum]KMT21724.1 murein peptide carboxypeptidase [Clostridium cylindrosporum DSM 605]
MIKPKALSFNDEIGIIAPSGPFFNSDQLEKSIDKIKKIGFKPILGRSCYAKDGFLAGGDDVRAKDINIFFDSSNIKAIVALRGGYGAMRILDKIDYKSIRKNPKIFVGYSDITAIHSAINKYSNLVTFHGPMIYSDFYRMDKETLSSFLHNVMDIKYTPKYDLEAVVEGDVSGKIFGGNLTILTSLLGSKYQVNYKDIVLFLEEINEEPYKVDRMLYQLYLSGAFEKVKGVILGQFTSCNSYDKERSYSLEYVLEGFFKKYSIPCYKGLNIGHDESKITIPLGASCKIIGSKLILTEGGVK